MKILSENISEFLEMLIRLQNDAQYYREEILRTEQLTMDYLHQLELETTSYHDRAKIASALRVARQQRRTAKDNLEISEPLLAFSDSERGKMLINVLREVLGKTRKAEKLVQNRAYMPRVLSAEEYHKKPKKAMTK